MDKWFNITGALIRPPVFKYANEVMFKTPEYEKMLTAVECSRSLRRGSFISKILLTADSRKAWCLTGIWHF